MMLEHDAYYWSRLPFVRRGGREAYDLYCSGKPKVASRKPSMPLPRTWQRGATSMPLMFARRPRFAGRPHVPV